VTVWGTDAVEAARGELRIAPGDLVTPLARERAAELGVAIVPAQGAGQAKRPLGNAAPGRTAEGPAGTGKRPLGNAAPARAADEAAGRGTGTAPALGTALGALSPAVAGQATSGALYRRGAPVPRSAGGRE